MKVWLVAATSYYDDPVVHHIAETEAAAIAWAEAHHGLDKLSASYAYRPAVVLEWVVGSTEEIEPVVSRRQYERFAAEVAAADVARREAGR